MKVRVILLYKMLQHIRISKFITEDLQFSVFSCAKDKVFLFFFIHNNG
jgi:hypothetical protein